MPEGFKVFDVIEMRNVRDCFGIRRQVRMFSKSQSSVMELSVAYKPEIDKFLKHDAQHLIAGKLLECIRSQFEDAWEKANEELTQGRV